METKWIGTINMDESTKCAMRPQLKYISVEADLNMTTIKNANK